MSCLPIENFNQVTKMSALQNLNIPLVAGSPERFDDFQAVYSSSMFGDEEENYGYDR